MRLEEDEHAVAVADSLDRGAHLRRVMRVVVQHSYAAGLPAQLEAASRALELGEVPARLVPVEAGQLECSQRCGCVPPVVLAWDRELEVNGLELVGADDIGHFGQPALEQLLDLGERRELRVVVEIDVRDDRDLRPQPLDRAVGLVALDDQPARACTRIAPELRDLTADQERRVSSRAVERERDHRGGRRLAVRAGNDDRVLQRNELGKELRPASRDTSRCLALCLALGQVRGGHDQLVVVRTGLDRFRHHDGDLRGADVVEVRRLVAVPAADFRAPGLREHCIAGEAGAADSDEPELSAVKTQAGSTLRRSPLPRSASRRASSPRPSPSGGRGRRGASGRGRRRGPAPSRAP